MRLIMIAGWLLAGANLAQGAAVATGIEPAASAPQPSASASPHPGTGADTIYATDPEDAANQVAFQTAISMIRQGHPELATAMLDKLIPRLEKRHAKPGRQLYCAYSQTEALSYATQAAVAKQEAQVLHANDLCDAYFFRGYAYVDLGKRDAAEADLKRAIEMAPNNPHYLSEMGEFESRRHDWTAAMGYYERARDAATPYAPDDAKVSELTRALRGIGYVDVELDRLDDAEAMYRRCLDLDANDQKAQRELEYVLNLRAQRVGPGQ